MSPLYTFPSGHIENVFAWSERQALNVSCDPVVIVAPLGAAPPKKGRP